MAEETWAVLHVPDVARHVAFYTERLGWTLDRHDLAADVVRIVEPDGHGFLLAGPAAGDLAAQAGPGHAVYRPGATIRVPVGDLNAQRAALAARGVDGLELSETDWGDRILRIPAPDGYVWCVVTPLDLAPEETLSLYLKAPQELAAALADVPERVLDAQPEPGAWSIRELAQHIVDGDDLWAMPIKAALAASGCTFSQDWYDTDNRSAQALDYAGLALEPAVTLFRAHRAYIAALIRHLPDAWQRYVLFARGGEPEAQKITVEEMVRMQARHALEHIEEIRAQRRHLEEH